MDVLMINQTEVQQILSMERCVAVMREALTDLAREKAGMPLRTAMWLPGNSGALGMMPAYIEGKNIMGIKVISVFPENSNTQYDSHQGAVMLFETKNGKPLTIIDACEITAIRTAAVSAVSTDLLAKNDASCLTILGSGTQAYKHLEAMLQIRPIKKINVWSRTWENAQKFAEHENRRHGCMITPVESAGEAVSQADIICTTTSSTEPVLFGKHIKDGAHINAIGSCIPSARELDTDAMLKSKLFVDRIESAINEAGDFMIPKKEGVIKNDHIQCEIGDILTGKHKGRETDMEITLFESLGIAIEDMAAAWFIYEQAVEKNIGKTIDFGGIRHDINRSDSH